MVVQALTTDLIRLMKNARINLPGAIDGNIQLELFNTLNEFCTETKIWKEDIDFATVVDQTDYMIYEAEPASIVLLMYVKNADDITVAATMETPGTIVLGTEPSEVETLTATVALTVVDPTDAHDYPRMPDWLLKRHYATILSGVLSKMMSQPAKPYSNERLAVFQGRKFSAGIAAARSAVIRQNLYGAQRWRYPLFAPGNQR